MSGEQNMRQRVIQALKPLDAISVENSCGPGTPDVNYIGGWLELKRVAAWPANLRTPVRIPHFSPQQKVWLARRCQRGGRAYVLLQVERDWFLIDGLVAASGLGTWNRDDLLFNSAKHWFPNLVPEELLDFLK
jgi:hypothetical protein